MSKFKSDKVMPRYFAIAVVLTLIGFAVVGKAMYIMTAKKDYWTQVASRLKRDSVTVKPNRGNILSSDGQLMASSLPEYKVYMDFQAGANDSLGAHKRDSIWAEKIDSISYELNQIFPSKSAAEFKAHLLEGKHPADYQNGNTGRDQHSEKPFQIDEDQFSPNADDRICLSPVPQAVRLASDIRRSESIKHKIHVSDVDATEQEQNG